MHKLAKRAKSLSYGYTLNTTVAMSECAYRTLSPSVQYVLTEAMEETGAYCTQLAAQQALIDLENLSEKHGVPVVHPPQGAWRDSFTTAIRQICDGGLLARELYEELQSP